MEAVGVNNEDSPSGEATTMIFSVVEADAVISFVLRSIEDARR